MVQLLHLYMTIGKTIAFTRQTFVGKVISLLFNMLSSLVMLNFLSFCLFVKLLIAAMKLKDAYSLEEKL